MFLVFFFFFQAEDGIRDVAVTGVQTCALPICVAELPRAGVTSSGAGRRERDDVRHDLGGKEVYRCRRLSLTHVAEHQPADEVGASARGDLALDLLTHATRRTSDGDAALARLVEVAG